VIGEIGRIIKLIIIMFILIGCSTKLSPQKIGYWINTYPSEFSVFQCVEPFTPYKNKEC